MLQIADHSMQFKRPVEAIAWRETVRARKRERSGKIEQYQKTLDVRRRPNRSNQDFVVMD